MYSMLLTIYIIVHLVYKSFFQTVCQLFSAFMLLFSLLFMTLCFYSCQVCDKPLEVWPGVLKVASLMPITSVLCASGWESETQTVSPLGLRISTAVQHFYHFITMKWVVITVKSRCFSIRWCHWPQISHPFELTLLYIFFLVHWVH